MSAIENLQFNSVYRSMTVNNGIELRNRHLDFVQNKRWHFK